MNKIIIISLMIAIVLCQTYSTNPCTCTQLLSDGDCLKNLSLNCAWDTSKKTCAVSNTTTTPEETYVTYCQGFAETDCPKAKPCETCGSYAACQWYDKKCTHFTGCTAHQKTTDGECQAISNRCITDGVHCVEINTCDSYLKQLPCVKNSNQKYCYWNTTDNKCEDASTCDKLPTSLNTDTLCRAQITTCMTTKTGGCVDSGTNCVDQKLDIQCVWNKAMTQSCYWTGTECKDKTCDNAPTSMVTDDACKSYISTCTTKQGGGCITRTSCSAALIQASCIKNNLGADCYWNGTACLDKICTSAPTTMTTNTACSGFKSNCITKNGGGCVENNLCSAANIAIACVKNINGFDCIFDNNTCKEKTCSNAPTSNNTHELCQSYLSTCTVKSGGGCQDKTCSNAPTTFTQNSDCETYFPKTNCIAKQGGGCEVLSTCSSITMETNCTKDVNGNTCIFNGTCKDKTCANSPDSNNTQELCSAYSSSCTIDSNNKCVDKTCENTLTEVLCTNDLNNKACLWKGNCFAKQCAFAPQTITSQQDCQNYLPSCTLSNKGNGCMDIPQKCESFTSETTCTIRQNGNATQDCAWNGTTCVDKSCLTAPKSITDNVGCSQYLSGCVLANSGSGCQELPSTCGARKIVDICSFETGPACVWNGNTSVCLDKSCATASMDGVSGKLQTFDSSNCSSYFGCLINSDSNGCIPKPTSCSTLSINNCLKAVKADGGDCAWDSQSSSCKEYKCTELTMKAHAACKDFHCTVKNDKSGCQAFAACKTYTLQDNCMLDNNDKPCKWNSSTNKCEDTTCADAAQTTDYNTSALCAAFINSSGTCNLISRVESTGGCAVKLSSCSDYIQEGACHKTLGNTGSTDDCEWVSGACKKKSTSTTAVICSEVTLDTYVDPDCIFAEGTGLKCKGNATSSACVDRTCIDFNSVVDSIFTQAGCQTHGADCTLDNGDQARMCQIKQAHCGDYKEVGKCSFSTDGSCYYDTNDSTCKLVGDTVDCGLFMGKDANCQEYSFKCKGDTTDGIDKKCVSKVCSDYAAANSWTKCQGYDPSCSLSVGGIKCTDKKNTCAEYSQANCAQISATGYCNWNGSACVDFNIATSSCAVISHDNSTNMCDYKSGGACTVVMQTGECQTKAADCNAYDTVNKCTYSKQGQCVWNDNLATGQKCFFVATGDDCSKVAGDGLSQEICKYVNSACILNSGGSACQKFEATCAAYSVDNCNFAKEGQCFVQNNVCTLKTCELAATTNTTNQQCETFLSTCTIARPGGCMPRIPCTSYITLAQCTYNDKNEECYWNVVNKNCVESKCENYEANASFDSASKCEAKQCIIKTTGSGCQNRAACNTYTQTQCTATSKNTNGGLCAWNANLATPACQDMSCATAPNSLNDDTKCSQYLSGKCTVAAVVDPATKAATYGGCIPRAECSTYIAEGQCKFNANKGKCGWNGTKCDDFSCLTAPPTDSYNTHDACHTYKSGCTVNSTKQGCIPIPDKCEGMIQEQCLSDNKGNLCTWIEESSTCANRTCDNAPKTIENAAGCAEYLSICTKFDEVKCQTKVCEDYTFTTDALCKAAISTCTSDGVRCITRGTCAQAQHQAGCVKSSTNQDCEWVTPATGNAYCTIKNCTTAPNTLTQESQCASYYPGCTTKKNGGCEVKTTCSAASVQSACTKSSLNVECTWDVDKCRDKDCQDFNGKTHLDCKNQRSNCTAGLNGKCARISTCENATVRQACIEGTNGPCLWISGACYSYTSCNSLSWQTNNQCKLISSQCTTNGTKCVGITNCAETNINGGCVTGYDGDCIQSVPSLDSTDAKCKLYTSCSDAFYLTHEQCQQASYKCTTNKQTGCIPLAGCSTYTNIESCKINDKGQVLTNNKVTSTGICTWDTTALTCRDQTCSDLSYQTHSDCNSTLSTCSSDGTTCINQGNCQTYTTDGACNNALGLDGVCFWVAQNGTTAASCRVKTCDDVQNGTTNAVCQTGLSSCISDGTKCVLYSTCSTYKTQASCNNGGSDGICLWKSTTTGTTTTGTCSLMTSCTSAANDQNACNAAKLKCNWTPAVTGTKPVASKCETHTCATYQQTNGSCSRFFSWDSKLQQICTAVNGVCQQTDPTTLTQADCYNSGVTGYSYTWNLSTSKCGVCTNPTTTPNITNNTVDNTINTESGQIMSVFITVLSYVLI